MRSAKKDIPLVIIDTRNKGLRSMQDDRMRSTESPRKEVSFFELVPLLVMVLQKMWISIQEPMRQASRKIGWFLREKVWVFLKAKVLRRDLPWFKITVLALLAFVMMKKDFQLDFAVASPLSIFGEDRNHEEESNLAQSLSVSNPYAPLAADDLQERRAKKFIRANAELAQTEMKKYGIPASIKMAQALIESRAGTSRLAENNNNFFGMKCFSKNCKKGHCSNATDDHHKDFFRVYKNPIDSWRAHSKLISHGRYAHLSDYGKDYKKWAVGLKKAGYATDKRYHQKLINTIEKYQLYRLDQ